MIQFRNSRYVCFEDGRIANSRTGKFLKPRKRNDGYFDICLYMPEGKKYFYVHRIVAECFVPNYESMPEVNHIDGDKSNNSYLNLEWCTSSFNQIHAFKSGLQKPTVLNESNHGTYKGPIFGKPVLGGETIKIRALTECESHGFTGSSVHKVLSGDLKTHKGYVFWRE